MIAPLGAEHVSQVATIHCATVPSLLRDLGPAAARAYYSGCLRTPLAAGFVDVEDGTVRGFVLGSPRPDQLRPAILRANPGATLAGVVAGIVARPGALLSVIRSFRSPDQGSYDRNAAELIYLGVAEDQRGAGIGKRLVNAFSAEMRTRGIARYELSVDEDNRAAIAFYERLGFSAVGQYHEFGRLHRRYRMDLGA